MCTRPRIPSRVESKLTHHSYNLCTKADFVTQRLCALMGHMFPQELKHLLFLKLHGTQPIPLVTIPPECLEQTWCTWPEKTPETLAAIEHAPLFALVVARMVWCQWIVHELAFSHPHREMVYLITLYMDQHIPLILAFENAGVSNLGTVMQLYSYMHTADTTALSLLVSESILPHEVLPICNDTLPPNLIGPQTLLIGSGQDRLTHLFEKAFPRRCFSREMEQSTIELLRDGDKRVLHIYLCSLLGNYDDVSFRLSLAPRIALLRGGLSDLVHRAESWSPSASHAIREYVARSQLSPNPYATVMGLVLRDFTRYWRNVIMTCEAAVRPNVEYLLMHPGETPRVKEDVAVWTKHASHNVSLPKRREGPPEHIRRLLMRHFPNLTPRESELAPQHQRLWELLHLEQIPTHPRESVSKLIGELDESNAQALLFHTLAARKHQEKRRKLAFYPLPFNYWELHRKIPRTVHNFCPKCFTLSFALPGVQSKPAVFVLRCHKGVYERVCSCEPGGVPVCAVDLRGFIVSTRKTCAIMCTSCFVVTRVQDGSFRVGERMFLCNRCLQNRSGAAREGYK